ncbi:MAG: NADH-quinone oxidoreductase subunit D, partial [Thermoprotei archaeon]
DIFICGRVCGICNTVHANCYVRALEALLGMDPPPRAKYLRVLAMELERVHSHMLINAVMAEVLGYETLFMSIMRDREAVMKAKEILTGGRVLADYMMVGGVRRDIDEVKRDRLLKILDRVEERVRYYRRVFEDDPTIGKRLMGVGILTPRDIVSHSLIGPVARGSGVKIDVRFEDPYDAYPEIEPLRMVTRDEGDYWASMMVRWDETLVSIEVSRYVLEHLPQGNAVPDERRLPRRFPPGEAFTRAEAPRGELTYYVMSDGKPNPYRVKIRTPSFNNIINGAFAFVGAYIADAPVILVSFDPCISCMERVTVVDPESGARKRLSLRELAVQGVM